MIVRLFPCRLTLQNGSVSSGENKREDYGHAICCIYQCPGGSQLTGLCEPV